MANVTVTNAGAASASGATAKVELFELESGASLGVQQASLGAVAAGESASVLLSFAVHDVSTWGPTQPALYRAVATVSSVSSEKTPTASDTEAATFGVRSFSFNSSAGFVLNGQPLKLFGGCVHHDNGPLGSKAIGRAEERR